MGDPLLASAIYSGAPPDRRREAHRRLSKVVPNVEERGLSWPGRWTELGVNPRRGNRFRCPPTCAGY